MTIENTVWVNPIYRVFLEVLSDAKLFKITKFEVVVSSTILVNIKCEIEVCADCDVFNSITIFERIKELILENYKVALYSCIYEVEYEWDASIDDDMFECNISFSGSRQTKEKIIKLDFYLPGGMSVFIS